MLRGGHQTYEKEIEDLKRFGMSEADAKAFVGQDAAETVVFGVWPDNWQTIKVFYRLSHYWRFHPTGQPAGLIPGAIQEVVTMMGIKRREWPEVFDKVCLCVRVVLGGVE